MTIEPGAMAIISALASALATMAGLVYRELRSQITDRDARIATLETEAREAVRAKDTERVEALKAKEAEVAEWRKLAQRTERPR